MPEEMDPIEKNIREQYQRLGQFVEAFEQMVHEVRSACSFLLDPKLERQMVVSTALHHSVMTAKPLFDILRAIVAETVKNEKVRKAKQINEETRNILSGVLRVINEQYTDLVNTRNNLLHGTWFVGFGDKDDPESEEFAISKLSVSQTGVAPLELPKNATQLAELASRCRKLGGWIGAINVAFIYEETGPLIKATFRNEKGTWIRSGPSGDETLP